MSWSSIGVPSVPGLPKNIGDAAIKFGGSLLNLKLAMPQRLKLPQHNDETDH